MPKKITGKELRKLKKKIKILYDEKKKMRYIMTPEGRLYLESDKPNSELLQIVINNVMGKKSGNRKSKAPKQEKPKPQNNDEMKFLMMLRAMKGSDNRDYRDIGRQLQNQLPININIPNQQPARNNYPIAYPAPVVPPIPIAMPIGPPPALVPPAIPVLAPAVIIPPPPPLPVIAPAAPAAPAVIIPPPPPLPVIAPRPVVPHNDRELVQRALDVAQQSARRQAEHSRQQESIRQQQAALLRQQAAAHQQALGVQQQAAQAAQAAQRQAISRQVVLTRDLVQQRQLRRQEADNYQALTAAQQAAAQQQAQQQAAAHQQALAAAQAAQVAAQQQAAQQAAAHQQALAAQQQALAAQQAAAAQPKKRIIKRIRLQVEKPPGYDYVEKIMKNKQLQEEQNANAIGELLVDPNAQDIVVSDEPEQELNDEAIAILNDDKLNIPIRSEQEQDDAEAFQPPVVVAPAAAIPPVVVAPAAAIPVQEEEEEDKQEKVKKEDSVPSITLSETRYEPSSYYAEKASAYNRKYGSDKDRFHKLDFLKRSLQNYIITEDDKIDYPNLETRKSVSDLILPSNEDELNIALKAFFGTHPKRSINRLTNEIVIPPPVLPHGNNISPNAMNVYAQQMYDYLLYARLKKLNPEADQGLINIRRDRPVFINTMRKDYKTRSELRRQFGQFEKLGYGHKRNNAGLTDEEIDKIMSHRKQFLGCYDVDDIKDIHPPDGVENFGFCIFLPFQRDGDEGHWVAVFVDRENKKIEYYDPFGDPPPKRFNINHELKMLLDRLDKNFLYEYKINRVVDQRANSSTCGYHCIDFIIKRIEGETFKDCTGYSNIENSERDIKDMEEYIDEFGYI